MWAHKTVPRVKISNMGISTDLFVSSVPKHLLCAICRDALKFATMGGCLEGHVFCSSCVKTWIKTKKSCPECREKIDETSLRKVKLLDRMIGELRTTCSYSGCSWEGEYAERAAHRLGCFHRPQPCPNAEHGCPKSLSVASLPAHLAECRWATENCPRGGADCGGDGFGAYLVKDRQEHFNVCEKHVCTTPDCTTIGTIAFIAIHRPGCEVQQSKLVQSQQAKDSAEQEVVKLRERVEALEAKLVASAVASATALVEAEEKEQGVSTRAMKRKRGE